MAVTKRTRFEVLRRDNHTCQYCGAKAPDTTLHIDHVMPVALGGDDKPGNLVAACKDCNSGKSSITPDSPLVEGVSDRAAAYALGMLDKMTKFRQSFINLEGYKSEFLGLWDSWTLVGKPDESVPLPDDYELSLLRWQRLGIPMKAFDLAITKAMKKPGVRGEHGVFQYMAGVLSGMLDDYEIDLTVTQETAFAFTSDEAESWSIESYQRGVKFGESAGYKEGFSDGGSYASAQQSDQDFLTHHIDGSTSPFIQVHAERHREKWREITQESRSTSGTTMTLDS